LLHLRAKKRVTDAANQAGFKSLAGQTLVGVILAQ
jgi:hypothetical protein